MSEEHNLVSKLDHDPVVYYTKSLQKYSILSKEEEYELACAVKNGDKFAESKFIKANLRLVLKIAAQYKNRGLSFSDVIEEGNLGLLHAVKRYEPEKGFRFATYAIWWIRQSIERALMTQTRTVRLPVHIVKRLSRCMRLGTAAANSANINNLTDAMMAESANVSVEDVRFLMAHKHNTVSLEEKTYSDSSQDFEDFIADDVISLEEAFTQNDMNNKIKQHLSVLSSVEFKVLSYRFGFGDFEELSLNAIADKLKITREQVRRVIKNALKKIHACLLA